MSCTQRRSKLLQQLSCIRAWCLALIFLTISFPCLQLSATLDSTIWTQFTDSLERSFKWGWGCVQLSRGMFLSSRDQGATVRLRHWTFASSRCLCRGFERRWEPQWFTSWPAVSACGAPLLRWAARKRCGIVGCLSPPLVLHLTHFAPANTAIKNNDRNCATCTY